MEVNFVVFNNLHYKMQIEILGSDYKCLTFKPVHLVKVIISLLHVTGSFVMSPGFVLQSCLVSFF